jgi:hypothetical protein
LPDTLERSASGTRRVLVTLWLIGMVAGVWALLIALLLTGRVAGMTPATSSGIPYDTGKYSVCSYQLAKQSVLPAPIYEVFAAVAGKDVPIGKLLLVLSVIALTLIIIVTLISNAVYSSIISLGRNPSAHFIILGGLGQVLAFAIGALGLSGALVWIILRI